jgi:hypothetical protein
MKQPKRILVAIKDPAARTMPAVRKAAQLARASGSTLELFHSLSETVMVDVLEARRQSLREYEQERHAAIMKRLELSLPRPNGTTRSPRRSFGADYASKRT